MIDGNRKTQSMCFKKLDEFPDQKKKVERA